jgi:hypothetical protein
MEFGVANFIGDLWCDLCVPRLKNTVMQLTCISCMIGGLASDFAEIGIVGDVSVSSTKRRITRSLETEDGL